MHPLRDPLRISPEEGHEFTSLSQVQLTLSDPLKVSPEAGHEFTSLSQMQLTLRDPLKALPEHQEWLRTTLLARLGCADEVEEVMQEVAIAAANQSAKREPVERVAPWLYRVALRQMLLFRRKAGRRKKLIANAAQLLGAADTVGRTREPLDWLISLERQSEVRTAMSSMSERDRQLLMLKYVDGLSYGQIAERIGVTASSVQSRLHRARGLLREQLLNSRD